MCENFSIVTRNQPSVLRSPGIMGLSLVYHAGALGDFVTTLPAISVWRRLHLKDTMVLLGKGKYGALAPQGLFDDFWEASSFSYAPLFGNDREVGSALRKRLRGLQSALLFSSSASPLSQNLSRLGVPEILRQDPFPTAKVPIVDYHLSLFPDYSLTREERIPQIRCERGALEVPADTVALHPGSGDPRKNWPFEKFQDMAQRLMTMGFAVRWVLGPAEDALALSDAPPAWKNISLSELAGALAACCLFVGNDSGITHLAAAAGCPTVALFGASDPDVWAPRGRTAYSLRAPRGVMDELSVEMILSECRDFLRR
jgi:hypothetical protein